MLICAPVSQKTCWLLRIKSAPFAENIFEHLSQYHSFLNKTWSKHICKPASIMRNESLCFPSSFKPLTTGAIHSLKDWWLLLGSILECKKVQVTNPGQRVPLSLPSLGALGWEHTIPQSLQNRAACLGLRSSGYSRETLPGVPVICWRKREEERCPLGAVGQCGYGLTCHTQFLGPYSRRTLQN